MRQQQETFRNELNLYRKCIAILLHTSLKYEIPFKDVNVITILMFDRLTV